jgi:hypothetical protein
MPRVPKARLLIRQLGLFVSGGTPFLKFSEKLVRRGSCGFGQRVGKI